MVCSSMGMSDKIPRERTGDDLLVEEPGPLRIRRDALYFEEAVFPCVWG